MTYLLRRGDGRALRRVAHLARYDGFGTITGPWCGTPIELNLTSNVPWGRPSCKHCLHAMARERQRSRAGTYQ
jgi:hypothetical protein